MHKAAFSIEVGQTPMLPSVCAKTGVPTDGVIRQIFAQVPGWSLLLIFWGIIPFLIAAGFARRKVTVDLPISEQVRRRIHMVDLGSAVGLVVGIGLFAAAAAIGAVELAAGAGVVVLVTLIGGSIARRVVWVSGRLDGDVLWLYGVHPNFARQAGRFARPDLAMRATTDRSGAAILVVGLIAVIAFLLLALLPSR
ncbi:MAG: hypothetical protein GWP04_03350 [Gammaproteobacteria bacterium]|nr:hypothetical protein [Gammaproteobacteria bacterium]